MNIKSMFQCHYIDISLNKIHFFHQKDSFYTSIMYKNRFKLKMGKFKTGSDQHNSDIKSFNDENSMVRIHSKLDRTSQKLTLCNLHLLTCLIIQDFLFYLSTFQ